MRRFEFPIFSLTITVLLHSCGAQTNLLGLTVPPEHKDSFEALLSSGRAAYDNNDLKKAHDLLERAHQLNPNSEAAAVLFGYANLSLAGADPYSLAQGLSQLEKTKKPKKDEPETAANFVDDNSESKAEDSDTNDTLGALKSIVGLSADDFDRLGLRDDSDPELPLIVPKCAEEVRPLVQKLAYVDAAVKAVCPFIPIEARSLHDGRQRCLPHEGPLQDTYKALFLWAFSHLTEALTFHSVLTYATVDPTGKRTNLELRVDRMKDRQLTDPAQLQGFLAAVKALDQTVSAILPVGGVCSEHYPTTQFTATLNDLFTVDKAFGMIPGIPPSITASISKAMTKTKEIQSAAGSRGDQAKAMKGDFTKKVSASLAEKIDKIEAESGQVVTPAQRSELCSAFTSISAEAKDRPELCNTLP